MNKKTDERAVAPLSGMRGRLAIAGLALMLALVPTMAHGAVAAESAPGATTAEEPVLVPPADIDPAVDVTLAADALMPPRFADSETRPTPPVDENDTADHTMTFYYYETVYYDDPDFDDPSGVRLLKKVVVPGLKAGQQLDTRDYVEQIDGHVFFDAYPARPIVSSDESLNYVELVYFKTLDNSLTVNYYEVKGQPGALVGSDDIAVEKMGAFTVDNQRFDLKVTADQVTAPLDGMVCVDSYPDSLRLASDPDKNVISVFYTDVAATLPDAVEQPEEDPDGTPDVPTTPDAPTTPDTPDVPTTPAPPATDAPTTPGDTAPDAPGNGDGSDNPDSPDGSDDPADKPATDGNPGDGSDADLPGADDPAKPEGDAAGATGPTDGDAAGDATGATDASAAADAEEPKSPTALAQTGDSLPAMIALALSAATAAAAALWTAARRLATSRR